MADKLDVEKEEELLLRATLRLNGNVLGVILGLVLGLMLFVATNWLVFRGPGLDMYGNLVLGPHLALLGQYLIGYRVSFVGSLIGLVYALAIGWVTGQLICRIYNGILALMNRNP